MPSSHEPKHSASRRKLIEVSLPLEAINVAAKREKSIRKGHPSTFHLWWARRPLAACRAVLFAQLVDDPSCHPDRFPTTASIEQERSRLFAIIEQLVAWESTWNEEVLERARVEIRRSCGGEVPTVYDPFSGGGSIPLEAQRLGLGARGSDLNPVAVLVGKGMIEIPPKFQGQEPLHPGPRARNFYRNAEGLAEDILYYGKVLRDRAFERIGHLYPKASLPRRLGGGTATVMAWLWARTVPCPDPAMRGTPIPLVSSYWLCRKPTRKTWVEPTVHEGRVRFTIVDGQPAQEDAIARGNKVGRGPNFICPLTGASVNEAYVKAEGMAGRMGWQLLAVAAEGKRRRLYVAPTEEQEKVAFSHSGWRPDAPLPRHPQYMSVTNYGPTIWGDLFTARQSLALQTFTDLVPEVAATVDAPPAYQAAVGTYLALCVSRLANRQSTSTFWDPAGENHQQVFAMQALPMRWDTAEGNPFSTSSGSFVGQVRYLSDAVANFPARGNSSSLTQANAVEADMTGCVISTDPPYYDNVPYADLSDFFYVWLRRALRSSYPQLFDTVLTPKAEELVADHQRHDGRQAADTFFMQGMTQVMRNMAEQGHQDYPITIYYAFRQEEAVSGQSPKGWTAFLQALVEAGWEIRSTWPVRTELTGNLKKHKNALATSVVLSCRRRPDSARETTRADFLRELYSELPSALRLLLGANIAPADLPQSAIGPGMTVFSRYAAVLEADDRPMSVGSALKLINAAIDEFLNDLDGEFDPQTRFATTWFEQHGTASGDFGTADNLARARGVSVDAVAHAGIVDSRAGRVRLLTREELDPDWPADIHRDPTVWECLQHLVKTLEEEGEVRTAELLGDLGAAKADAARELGYYLYGVCSTKRQDAKEASAYNGLITVWRDLMRLAAEARSDAPDRQTALDL